MLIQDVVLKSWTFLRCWSKMFYICFLTRNTFTHTNLTFLPRLNRFSLLFVPRRCSLTFVYQRGIFVYTHPYFTFVSWPKILKHTHKILHLYICTFVFNTNFTFLVLLDYICTSTREHTHKWFTIVSFCLPNSK